MVVNIEDLNEIIIGRVEPHIYAFSTDTIPKYTKIGDTYRSVDTRLNEWKEYFPNLKKEYEGSARIEDLFFRDYAVHKYLENELQKTRLKKEDISEELYYSREFFKDVKSDDLDKAIEDIRNDFNGDAVKYSFYDVYTLSPSETHYERGDFWELRDNQKEAVDNFIHAKNNGRTNLLMYAVMRFGKSFTALCCAKQIENLKLIVVVSAKADVKEEWKKNTEIPKNFENFEFKTSKDLIDDENLISNHLNNPSEKVFVLFLTLQDLMGDNIKEKHKELFAEQTSIDLLIIDETHFGARADKYGAVLKQPKNTVNRHDADEIKDIIDYTEQINKILKSRYKLHLSGTPYRILMGSEFQKEDIISFCQYSDIVDEQEKWDENNLLKDVDENGIPIKEWDNPYYGFPKLIRFAFNPNKSSRARLEEFKKDGNSFALSKLFEPQSKKKDTNEQKHKLFIYEKEVLELLEVIDGTKQDEEIFGFIDYDKIKQGNMCRHIVMVLPYSASCDAMENLIKTNSDKFKNLKDYEIINISSIDKVNRYKETKDVKNAIKNFEEQDKKTITLTVNRMLTGSTVEQWDTMIYLKDTASPQEYDQAIFRLQSQYIKTYKDAATGDTIKYNMKPQTLLVDFCVDRVFKMQELKSQIYNVNTDEAGNKKLKQRLERELKISPIIVINKDKIEQVTAANILEAVSDYSRNRGVAEETNEIPVDLNLKNVSEIWDAISKENELGSKNGFNIEAFDGEGEDIDTPETSLGNDNDESVSENETEEISSNKSQKSNEKDPVKQFRMYYARILYYAFLTNKQVYSIDSIIGSLDNEDNKRIFKNLGLNLNVVIALKDNMDKFMLRILDYKIQNLNKLANESNLEPLERANIANQKFGRIGESEIVTPEKVAAEMINLLPDEFLNECVENKIPILDIASKEGEFAIALYKRFNVLGYKFDDFKDLIYAIPTSNITYEFTRKIYEVLGLNIYNIAEKFNSYDLLAIKNGNSIDYNKISKILMQDKQFNEISTQDEIQVGGDEIMMKFGAVVGNPPYQVDDGGAQKSAKPIYHHFVKIAKIFDPAYMTLIIPSRWYAGGKGLDEFRAEMLDDNNIQQLDDFFHPEEVFPNTNNRGGICYFLRNSSYNNENNFVKVVSHYDENNIQSVHRKMRTRNLDIFIRDQKSIDILDKVLPDTMAVTMEEYISPRKPFGIESNIINSSKWNNDSNTFANPIKCLAKGTRYGYVDMQNITAHQEWIESWKVFTPRANNVGTELNDDNLNTIIGQPNSICTEAYIAIGANMELDQCSAQNLTKYFKTKFVRFMHGIAKASHDASRTTYRFVPVQDFTNNSDIDWSKSITEIDKQLYTKYGLSEEEISHIESMIKPME